MCTLKSVLFLITVCSLSCHHVFILPGGFDDMTKTESMVLCRRFVSLLVGSRTPTTGDDRASLSRVSRTLRMRSMNSRVCRPT